MPKNIQKVALVNETCGEDGEKEKKNTTVSSCVRLHIQVHTQRELNHCRFYLGFNALHGHMCRRIRVQIPDLKLWISG